MCWHRQPNRALKPRFCPWPHRVVARTYSTYVAGAHHTRCCTSICVGTTGEGPRGGWLPLLPLIRTLLPRSPTVQYTAYLLTLSCNDATRVLSSSPCPPSDPPGVDLRPSSRRRTSRCLRVEIHAEIKKNQNTTVIDQFRLNCASVGSSFLKHNIKCVAGTVCACVHRNKCIYGCTSVYDCTVLKKVCCWFSYQSCYFIPWRCV